MHTPPKVRHILRRSASTFSGLVALVQREPKRREVMMCQNELPAAAAASSSGRIVERDSQRSARGGVDMPLQKSNEAQECPRSLR